MEIYNGISFAGMFILMAVAWCFSENRRIVNFRLILWGLVIQFCFALFIFVVPAGTKVFLVINAVVVEVIASASAGTEFVFGRLAVPPGETARTGEPSLGFFLAFQAFPAIIFFSSLMAILYYLRIMPLIIQGFSRIFARLMRVSGAESLCAASNMFVGVESALTVKPYLNTLTRSELCTVLAAGMATVASNVLVLYVNALSGVYPNIAGHVVSASLLSAPAAIIMSKLVLPESGEPVTLGTDITPHYEKESNIFESVINGAQGGVRLVVGIVALLIAVLGLVALTDLLLGVAGGYVNHLAGTDIDWCLASIAGVVFYPLVLLLGVPLADVPVLAKIIGERLIVTEVVSYFNLAEAIENDLFVHQRSGVIGAYALCGFAHVASMAIFIGGIAALAPSQLKNLSNVGIRALFAATLACLMTACIAGIFYSRDIVLFQ